MSDPTFVQRKRDHLRIALLDESEARESALFDRVTLIHDSMPDLNLRKIQTGSPFVITGMTAGHDGAIELNRILANAASQKNWWFGVGSQRRELEADYQDQSLRNLKREFPDLNLISNIGIAQLIQYSKSSFNPLLELLDQSSANAIAIHLNPLQEAIQQEGTVDFCGGLDALEKFCSQVKVPVILKETGSGMGIPFLMRIRGLPLKAVDVSGLGGTHWGRIEGFRAEVGTRSALLGQDFQNWGVSTIDSILNAGSALRDTTIEIWASGGVRSGLDAAKCIALGASRVGFARPALQAAMQGEAELLAWMDSINEGLKVSMFCTNSATMDRLRDRQKWIVK
jgi:isopentenyl-diphosphate delta-isomerase